VEATLQMREHSTALKSMCDELTALEVARKKIFIRYNHERSQVIRYAAEAEGRDPPAWTVNQGDKQERAKFIMKCPAEECRGFLSTAYKCGTCQLWACPDCLVIKGPEKDVEHTCDPGQKESVALIIKESKGCPKCGQRISKIDGCFSGTTPILLWDGRIQEARFIQVGDELVGDNATKRTVQSVCSGEDMMYEVTQSRGVTYTVNSKHTLCLISVKGDPIDILVDEYLRLPSESKETLCGFSLSGKHSSITVTEVGRGTYYGWTLDNNHKFLLPDTTIVKNCDQMWCTDCHTAFSWSTGQIVNGVVHNPHYYEFLRQAGNGVAPRNIGDVPCGGIPPYSRIFRLIKDSEHSKAILSFHRITAEIQDQRIVQYQGRFRVEDNGDLGVKYLMKEISKDDMKAELVKRETKRLKQNAIRAVLEMFVTTSTILLNALVDTETPLPERMQICIQSFTTLRTYVNDALMNISRMKQCSVPQITGSWHWSSFNKVTPKPKVKAKAAAAPAPV
jgi:hypothetical protein